MRQHIRDRRIEAEARPKSEPQVKVTDSAGVQNAAVRKKIVEADNDNDDDDSSADAGASPAQTTGKSGIIPASERTKLHMTKSVHEAQPTARGDRSLIRALGLKIGKIVIDPGHGGYDTGTIGPNGLEEKDLVLDVCKRLGKLLEERLGAEVEYTRRDYIRAAGEPDGNCQSGSSGLVRLRPRELQQRFRCPAEWKRTI